MLWLISGSPVGIETLAWLCRRSLKIRCINIVFAGDADQSEKRVSAGIG